MKRDSLIRGTDKEIERVPEIAQQRSRQNDRKRERDRQNERQRESKRQTDHNRMERSGNEG